MTGDLIQIVDCLTADEVSRVLTGLNNFEWSPTTIFTQGAECAVNEDIRNNTRVCLLDSDPLAELMHIAMNAALIKYRNAMYDISPHFQRYPVPGSPDTSCYREQIQVLKYEPGQHYTWHHDQASEPSVNEHNRTISVVLYLQNAEEGGRTVFPHRAYTPKAGQALIFPSNWCFPHRGEEVIKGTKIAAVTWYHSYPLN